MIDHINRNRDAHIVTIEDPIEVLHSDDKRRSINQREVGVDTDDFAVGAARRHAPGPRRHPRRRDARRRDRETALAAAETGHLVMSTLHTTDATETINRIIDFFPPHEQQQVRLSLAGALKGIVCQRLVPRADGQALRARHRGLVVTGRVQTDHRRRDEPRGLQEIIADGDYYGMQTFDQSIIELYAKGVIDLRAALAGSTNPHDLSVAMRLRGLDSGGAARRSSGRGLGRPVDAVHPRRAAGGRGTDATGDRAAARRGAARRAGAGAGGRRLPGRRRRKG